MSKANNQTTLVTGGAGFIGSHTVRLLMQEDYSVVVLDTLQNGNRDSLPDEMAFYQGDISDESLVTKIVTEHDITRVIHFSAYIEAGESMKDPLSFYDNNVGRSVTFFKTLNNLGVKKIVFSSTAAVYGEPQFTPITEDHPYQPVNYYGSSKLMVEKILESCEYAYDWKAIRLRYFNAAGAGFGIGEAHQPETHLIPLILQIPLGKRDAINIFGTDYDTQDGTCVRDYIHVLDLAQAHIDALEGLEKSITGAFNVATGHGYSVQEVIHTCQKVVGQEIPVVKAERRPGDPAVLVADNQKIQRQLGWKPKYDLDDMVQSAWEWFQNHPQGYNA